MKSILERIFRAHEFGWEPFMENIPDWPSTFFAMRPSEHDKREYFVIHFVENLDVILGGNGPVAHYRRIINALEQHPARNAHFAKNMNLLIVLKVANFDYERILSQDQLLLKFYEIEEDPYFFKKHIIAYTDAQVASFKEKWPFPESDGSSEAWTRNLQEFAAKASGNEDWFTGFKDDVTNQRPSTVRLLTQLLIKIPFFQLIVNAAKLDNLRDKIDQSLGTELIAVRDLCLEELDTKDNEAGAKWLAKVLQSDQNLNSEKDE